MNNICTFDACESVRQAAESKGNERMLNALISVNNDLIAAEAKYHRTCFSSYVSKSNLKHREYVEKEGETVYDAAFQELAAEVGEGINQQKHTTCHYFYQDIANASAIKESMPKAIANSV